MDPNMIIEILSIEFALFVTGIILILYYGSKSNKSNNQ